MVIDSPLASQRGLLPFHSKTALYCRDCYRFLPHPRSSRDQLRCPDCHRQTLRQISYVFVHGCGEIVPIKDTIPIESPKFKGTIFHAPIVCQKCGSSAILRLDARSDRLSALEIRCEKCKSEVIGRFLARCPRCFPRFYAAAKEPSEMGQLAFRAAMRITRHSANNAYYPHSITILRLNRPMITQQSEEQPWLETLLPPGQRIQATGVSQTILDIAEKLRLAEVKGDTTEKARLLEQLARAASAVEPPRVIDQAPHWVPVAEDVSKGALESLALLSRVRRTLVVKASDTQAPASAKGRDISSVTRALGIGRIEHVSDLPVISATFGYTRRSPTPTHREERAAEDFPTTLRPFPALDQTAAQIAGDPRLVGTVPILAREGQHEGLAIFLDPTVVLKWLEAHGVQTSGQSADERRLSVLRQLEPIDSVYQRVWQAPTRRLLFGLLHTLSHCAMKALAATAGLETMSVSEYIFLPLFCTVVYSTATVELGGVRSTATDRMMEFADALQEHASRCLYDPDCLNRDGACHGCVHVPELTCRAFNHGLSRAFLIGGRAPWAAQGEQERVRGYWQFTTESNDRHS